MKILPLLTHVNTSHFKIILIVLSNRITIGFKIVPQHFENYFKSCVKTSVFQHLFELCPENCTSSVNNLSLFNDSIHRQLINLVYFYLIYKNTDGPSSC